MRQEKLARLARKVPEMEIVPKWAVHGAQMIFFFKKDFAFLHKENVVGHNDGFVRAHFGH